MPTCSRILSTVASCSALLPRFQIESGSSTMSRTLRRGFRDEIGSWKIIWILVRASRIASPDKAVRSVPLKTIEPDVGLGSCMIARPVVLFPQPDSPTMPRVSPMRTSKEIPLTALTFKPVRPMGNSTTRSSTRKRTSSVLRRCALPVPAISSSLLLKRVRPCE